MKYSVEIAEAPDPQRPNRRLETLVASVTTPPYARTGYSWVALMRPGERGEEAYLSPAREARGGCENRSSALGGLAPLRAGSPSQTLAYHASGGGGKLCRGS